MSSESVIDRCIDDLSSTLELAEALERQLEMVHESASKASDRVEAVDSRHP